MLYNAFHIQKVRQSILQSQWYFHLIASMQSSLREFKSLKEFIVFERALTKSAVMIASSVWDPGNQMALMMKLPVASCGCNTRWSDTEPVLLNVSTWQS